MDFAVAVRFLTIIPVPGADAGAEDRLPSPTTFFPVVGLLMGALLVAIRGLLPGDGLLPAALVLLAWTGLTGALHEDGWADCADAALPPVDRERRVEILRDPLVGAHGLVAVVLLLLVRLAGIADAPIWALAVAPVVGRWAMVLSLAGARPLRSVGLGASMAPSARPVAASTMAMAALVLVFLVSFRTGWTAPRPAVAVAAAAAVGVAGVLAWGLGTFLQQRLGGLSGDGHGAVGLVAETGALCALALWSGAAPAVGGP